MKQNINVAWKFLFATYFFIFFILLSTVGIGTVVASSPSISIDPASQSVSVGDTFIVDVVVDPAGEGISSGEINIAFDADIMQVDGIEPGNLLGASPIVATKEIDNTAGTIVYALARRGATTPPTPEGTFATITFTVDSDAPDGTYAIDITTVGLADEIIEDISGITINDGTVEVITTDTTPPTIEFVPPTPANGSTVTVNYVNVTVNVTDPSGVSIVALNWHGAPEMMHASGYNTWSVNKTNLSDGTYMYQVYARDTHDNLGASEVRTVNVMTAAAPTVSIEPASQNVSTGDTFTVDVVVDPAGYGVSGGEMNIAFDADAMQADSIEPGDLLGTNPLVGTEEINNTAGTIIYALARIGATAPPTPEGAFATITFTVKTDATEGTYALDIVSMGLSDENFNDIPGITINDGTVTVVTGMLYPPWDINQDGKVDYKDLGIFAATYGKSVGDPGYDARADLYGDGTIDYKDLGILAAHYGETYE